MKGSITTTRIVGALLVVMMILASVMAPGHSRVMAESEGGAVVDLLLLPSTQTVNVGDTFDITIEAQCRGQEITGVAAFLDFDPTYLEVVSITRGDTLDLVLLDAFDNAAGTIDYSAGTFTTPFPSDTFVVATIEFTAKAATDSTSISFHRDSPRATDADFGGTSKLDQTIGATVTITAVAPPRYTLTVTVDPEASGTVSLSPEQPADGYEAPTVVTLTAEAAAGWDFDRWSGAATGTDPVTRVTMDADKSVTAHFIIVAPIKINEFVSHPVEGEVEWIELYNPTDTEVDLTGWTIEDNTGSTYGGGGGDTSLDGELIPAGGYLVLEKGVDFTFGLTNPGDIIILKSGVAETDRVAYGNFKDDNTADNAPAPEMGESAGRFPNGVDTGVDAADFVVFTIPTPGAANAVAPPRYTLTVTVDPEASGTVSLSPEQPADGYEAPTVVTLTAEPAAGWDFSHWSGAATGTDPVTTVTMDADKSVTAHFTPEVPPPPQFTRTLPAGWNLLSTPIKLDADSDALGQMFAPDCLANIEVSWGWNPQLQRWDQLLDDHQLSPLYAIYVKIKADASATARFVPSQELSTPPGRELVKGVNLIGPAPALEAGVFPAMPLDVALISIEEAPGGLRGYTMVISPGLNQPGWVFALRGEVKDLLPFRGYWVVMDNADTLYGFSTTPIAP